MLVTPSLLEAIINAKNLPSLGELNLKYIFLCGEVVTTRLRERTLSAIPQVSRNLVNVAKESFGCSVNAFQAILVNLYSVSECHDVAMENLTTWNCSAEEERKYCPVGKLLDGVSIAILDDNMTLQPVGVAGEIYVGGPTLAKGTSFSLIFFSVS